MAADDNSSHYLLDCWLFSGKELSCIVEAISVRVASIDAPEAGQSRIKTLKPKPAVDSQAIRLRPALDRHRKQV